MNYKQKYLKYKQKYKFLIGSGLNFTRDRDVKEYRRLIFGREGVEPRLKLLETAKRHHIPIFIVTSGSAVDVVRSLELCNIDQYFTGVYLANQYGREKTKRSKEISGIMVEHSYSHLSKYEIIQKIMEKFNYSCHDSVIKGYFVDDTKGWGRDQTLCPNIQFINVINEPHQPVQTQPGTLAHTLEYAMGESKSFTTRGISQEIFNYLEQQIKTGNCQILFFDWDECFQTLDGPYPFESMNPLTKQRTVSSWLSNERLDSQEARNAGLRRVPIDDDYQDSDLHITQSSQDHPNRVENYISYRQQQQDQLRELRQTAHQEFLSTRSDIN